MIRNLIFILVFLISANSLHSQDIRIINNYNYRKVNKLLEKYIDSETLITWNKIVKDYNFRIHNISKSNYTTNIDLIKNTASLNLQGRYFNCRMNAFLLIKSNIIEFNFMDNTIDPFTEVEVNNYEKYGIKLNESDKYIYQMLFSTIYLSDTTNSIDILKQKYEKLKIKESSINILIVNEVYSNAIAVTHVALVIENDDETISIIEKLSPFDPFVRVKIKKNNVFDYYKELLSSKGHIVISIGNEILW
ncbi:MAG: hypothetical protein A2015_13070 [Spirochaetes bacterium GWF1_31_7]|nr:MAG: hypothetical protein A2Y30_00475 [Spirochaetes bacterium GWE1_32_154]OHD51317.1 MAG: hypothetical protein A2Y29_00920 [Spirochaetes bacterium GWE2_31_10]OHD51514.1 MAG: hypothetical protein A2015_13070 [Spirochaetes bacterium GWF1_31_7]OHD82897.1 MAG: hypothetical protein A2355_07660 [Spirochaetes bacterium RIFOXYB1_FULL_32_8]